MNAMHRCLGPGSLRVDCLRLAVNHIRVKRILYIGRSICRAEYELIVGFVFGEQQALGAVAIKDVLPQLPMGCNNTRDTIGAFASAAQSRTAMVTPPGPGVAEPQRRQQLQWSRIG